MKKYYLWFLIGLLLAGCSGGVKYAQYISKDPELDIVMDYVSGWINLERRDVQGGFSDVVFIENKREKIFKATMTVTAKKAATLRTDSQTTESLLDALIERRLHYQEARVLKKVVIKLGDRYASEVLMTYKSVDKPYDINTSLVPAKERTIVMRRGDWFYIMRYENTENEFDRYDKAFSHCLKTLKFKDSAS